MVSRIPLKIGIQPEERHAVGSTRAVEQAADENLTVGLSD